MAEEVKAVEGEKQEEPEAGSAGVQAEAEDKQAGLKDLEEAEKMFVDIAQQARAIEAQIYGRRLRRELASIQKMAADGRMAVKRHRAAAHE